MDHWPTDDRTFDSGTVRKGKGGARERERAEATVKDRYYPHLELGSLNAVALREDQKNGHLEWTSILNYSHFAARGQYSFRF